MRNSVGASDKYIEFSELYNISSKYFWLGMDIRCQKVTSTSVPIVKCMKEYLFKNYLP